MLTDISFHLDSTCPKKCPGCYWSRRNYAYQSGDLLQRAALEITTSGQKTIHLNQGATLRLLFHSEGSCLQNCNIVMDVEEFSKCGTDAVQVSWDNTISLSIHDPSSLDNLSAVYLLGAKINSFNLLAGQIQVTDLLVEQMSYFGYPDVYLIYPKGYKETTRREDYDRAFDKLMGTYQGKLHLDSCLADLAFPDGKCLGSSSIDIRPDGIYTCPFMDPVVSPLPDTIDEILSKGLEAVEESSHCPNKCKLLLANN